MSGIARVQQRVLPVHEGWVTMAEVLSSSATVVRSVLLQDSPIVIVSMCDTQRLTIE